MCPAPDWIPPSVDGATGAPLPLPSAEELAGWVGEGARVESIDDETTFVEPGMHARVPPLLPPLGIESPGLHAAPHAQSSAPHSSHACAPRRPATLRPRTHSLTHAARAHADPSAPQPC